MASPRVVPARPGPSVPATRSLSRAVAPALCGLALPGAGQVANGSWVVGSAALVAWGAAERFGVPRVYLVAAAAVLAAAAATAWRAGDTPPRLPGVGIVAAVAVLPGLVAQALAGAGGALPGLGQVANRTYARATIFAAAWYVAGRWGGGASAWVAAWALPGVSAAEACWTAWAETPA